MTKRFLIIAAITIMGLGIAAAAKNDVLPSGFVRYKMTVEVETPEGLKTGSAVREVTLGMMPTMLGPNSPVSGTVDIVGEAVVVDLGKRGKVFALLRDSNSTDYAYHIFFKSFAWHGNDDYGGALSREGIKAYLSLKSGMKILAPKDYPEIVSFKNMNDPKSVQLVYLDKAINTQGKRDFDYEITDNFENLFGHSVKIKRVSIEITQEPTTDKVLKAMPSYQDQADYMRWFSKLSYGDPLRINSPDFKKQQ